MAQRRGDDLVVYGISPNGERYERVIKNYFKNRKSPEGDQAKQTNSADAGTVQDAEPAETQRKPHYTGRCFIGARGERRY